MMSTECWVWVDGAFEQEKVRQREARGRRTDALKAEYSKARGRQGASPPPPSLIISPPHLKPILLLTQSLSPELELSCWSSPWCLQDHVLRLSTSGPNSASDDCCARRPRYVTCPHSWFVAG